MNTHLIFVYGSNLDFSQMKERCPSVQFISVHTLKGYQICFPHIAKLRGCGVASIKNNINSFVEGVLYLINSDDLINLDIREGLGNGYSRKLYKENGIQFWFYYSLKNWRNEYHQPSSKYIEQIINGAYQNSLSDKYIKILESFKPI